MKEIKIYRKAFKPKLVALVDDADYPNLVRFNWVLHYHPTKKYAKYNLGGGNYILMHQMVLPCPLGYTPDHIDGNGLNNQRFNLRIADKVDQGGNRGKSFSGGTSKYKGVCFVKASNQWRAEIQVKGIRQNIGLFDTEIEAAEAYNKVAKRDFGVFAKLNVIK